MKYLWWLFLIIILISGVAFAILNSESVALDYFFGSFSLPLIVVILSTFILGSVLGIIVGYYKGFKRAKKKLVKP